MEEDTIYALKGTSALYEVLGVPRTATQRDLRQAYYKLAVLYHPDKNPAGAVIFKEICFAYGILSDPEQRALYDSGILRQDLETKARAYDPSMDPNVELNPEDLRVFVDRVRQSQEANRTVQSSFEQRREEEMRRRAEFDAKNPAFKEEYERLRRLRQQFPGVSSSTPTDAPGGTHSSAGSSVPIAPKMRTSAEVLAELQREEERRLYGTTSTSSSYAKPTGGGFAMKRQMMERYRAAHSEPVGDSNNGEGSAGNSAASTLRGHQLASTTLPFVRTQCDVPQYSETIGATLNAYANYNYRSFVEKGSVDRGELEGAILADALGQYDRDH